MSLINEALKKAQKLRTGDPAAVAPMPGGGARVTKRSEPRSTQQLVLIAAGALLLVVLSIVGTFWFLNRTPETKPATKPIAVKPADPSVTSPTIVPPTTPPPSVAETPTSKAATPPGPTEKPGAGATPAPTTAVATTPMTPTPTPAAPPPSTSVATATTEGPATELAPAPTSATASTLASASSANVPTDARIHAYVDAIKVMGIRSSGGDSRVLMHDRVFRVNDIVDRTLGVRLTKVAADSLTFTDSNGAIYVKNF